MSDCSGSCKCGSKANVNAGTKVGANAEMRIDADRPAVKLETVERGTRAERRRSVFDIPGMDCPSEEQMIRLRLGDQVPDGGLIFDLPGRRLTVIHDGDVQAVLERLVPLGFGARLVESGPIDTRNTDAPVAANEHAERRVLWWLLGINGFMFFAEFGAGLWAQSAGLIADSLDMFADATVYALALYAVGRGARGKLRAAHLSGWFQLLLAIGALLEVGRRMVFGAEPIGLGMMIVAAVALVANVICLLLIMRHRHGGAHMRASFIFSANDVIANLGVILAGALVLWTSSPWPDWIIGVLIAAVVLNGAIRILRLR